MQRGYRIWYSTTDKLIAASYTFYDTEVIFEDEIVVYPIQGISSTIGKFKDNFLFTSLRDEEFVDFYSLTACASGVYRTLGRRALDHGSGRRRRLRRRRVPPSWRTSH